MTTQREEKVDFTKDEIELKYEKKTCNLATPILKNYALCQLSFYH